MTNKLNNLKQESEHIRLSTQEKTLMRSQIFERIDASERAQTARRPRTTHWFVFSMRYAVSFALVLMLLVGSTTAYAAQGSLPGAALYPVKIYVNENVWGALSVTPEAKASFHTGVAEERLREAEALASQGKLDTATAANLEANFNSHVEQADTIAQDLEESDPAGAVDAQVTLDSSLAAHSAILEKIGNESKDESTKENSNSIAIKIRSHSGLAVADTLSLKATVAPASIEVQTMSLSVSGSEATSPASSTTPKKTLLTAHIMSKTVIPASSTPATSTASQKKIAMQLQKKADSQLNDTHDDYSGAKRSLEATTSAKISGQLSLLDTRMKQGKKQFANKDYDAARATFTSVIKDSVELSATIEASKKYKQDFVRSWLKGSDEGQNNSQEDQNDKQKSDDTKKSDNASSTLELEVHL